ncbi:hypothetical protein TVAG_113890 [Trichomonas vaginalis G3]|uniref:Myb-like domain-containing protein n=1 Tax=Trichomonas vaginalis (strain ATCC PRA-98 / G3) TaxID=412133 RepID=A2DNP2_TRIV3|nr:homeodomain-like family [Trichomonas vaginalis G3]EAY18045.1 hypothetical protein TVAG_113890 [Trichomonas vaginalis G3]KAI5524389.1 homeodomain-like family [Trichomonas vaginalis G3]|eukprot:XP_001579031.1 hypothetical protein [Trichomonas vaginalis G3]
MSEEKITSDDLIFQYGIEEGDNVDWEKVAKMIGPSVTAEQVKNRFNQLCYNMARWSEEEIRILKELKGIQNKSERKARIQEHFPNRSYKSCIVKLNRL